MPERIQLSRRRGFKLPPNSVSVARPHRFSNPFNWKDGLEVGTEAWAKGAAVDLFRGWLKHPDDFPKQAHPPTQQEIVQALAGKNLACFCRLDSPCHADVLLSIANQSAQP